MNAEQLALLRAELVGYRERTPYAITRQHADATLRLLDRHAKPWQRSVPEGHLTASAWVVDRSGRYAAMIHHRKLNRWLQPGGHIDDTDQSWRTAAQRELAEETGLTAFLAHDSDNQLFDVDVHAIPARPDEPAHFHYDLRFLFVADVGVVHGVSGESSLALNAEESNDCRWFALSDMANDTSLGPETHRMIELCMRRINLGTTLTDEAI